MNKHMKYARKWNKLTDKELLTKPPYVKFQKLPFGADMYYDAFFYKPRPFTREQAKDVIAKGRELRQSTWSEWEPHDAWKYRKFRALDNSVHALHYDKMQQAIKDSSLP